MRLRDHHWSRAAAPAVLLLLTGSAIVLHQQADTDPGSQSASDEHAKHVMPQAIPAAVSSPSPLPRTAWTVTADTAASGFGAALAIDDNTATATQAGVKRAAQAIYLANAHYWTSSTSFIQACQGTVDAAKSLAYSDAEVKAIKDSWKDVGVYCDGDAAPPPPCDETLTTATGTVTSPNYPAAYPNNYKHTTCIDAPAGQQVTLTFSAFATEAGYDFVTLGDANGAVLSKTAGSTKPAAVTSSRIYVIFTSDSSQTKTGWSADWTTN